MYAPKIAWLSRTGMRASRFLWSVLVAKDAPTLGQLVIVPMTVATSWRSLSVVSSSGLLGAAEIQQGSVLAHGYRGACGDTRVNEHRDSERVQSNPGH